MEKKTMGGLIAALRRAEGMTQRELAERLNVSDKTVSRWEREEGSPDLALIPVLAEIFGVTCDELLRGERRSPDEREKSPSHSAKGEKERRHLLQAGLTRFRSRSMISLGLALVGLIGAMVGNLGFLRAYLGFFAGMAFLLISAVCQAVFFNLALLSASEGEPETAAFRRSAVRLTQLVLGADIILLAAILPLVLFTRDTYVGLSGGDWLLYGLLFGAVAAMAVLLACYLLNGVLVRRGFVSPENEETYWANHRLKRQCALTLAAVLSITALAHVAATSIWGSWSIMKATEFTDYDSFRTYMAMDLPAPPPVSYGPDDSVPVPAPGETTDTIWYDEYGNEVTREEASRRTLLDRNGQAVCEYLHLNGEVCSVQYTPGEGTALPIRVSTYAQLREAKGKARHRHVLFGGLYCAEVLGVLLFYRKKRAT